MISYCGTPLVYYIGLEENRRQARDYIRSRVGVVRVEPSPPAAAATAPRQQERCSP